MLVMFSFNSANIHFLHGIRVFNDNFTQEINEYSKNQNFSHLPTESLTISIITKLGVTRYLQRMYASFQNLFREFRGDILKQENSMDKTRLEAAIYK